MFSMCTCVCTCQVGKANDQAETRKRASGSRRSPANGYNFLTTVKNYVLYVQIVH